MSPTWVKICGVKSVADAREIAAAGADAIGLNFYPPSPRSVSEPIARAIAEELRGKCTLVGLFVNHSLEDILRITDQVGLEWVQLHGDEPVSLITALIQQRPQLKIIRAWRLATDSLTPLGAYLQEFPQHGRELQALLIDGFSPGAFGGTGTVAPWSVIARDYDREEWPALILAGGLTPTNVGAAISAVSPWGVDTASGVESRPGVKDLARVRDFIAAIRP